MVVLPQLQHKRPELHFGVTCYSLLFYFTFFNGIARMGFLPREIRVAFPRESQLRQSRATQRTMHAGCFSVSIIHWTLAWTIGSLTRTHMLMHSIAHGDIRTPKIVCTENWLWEKNACRTREWNLCQRHANSILYQLSYLPTLLSLSLYHMKAQWMHYS